MYSILIRYLHTHMFLRNLAEAFIKSNIQIVHAESTTENQESEVHISDTIRIKEWRVFTKHSVQSNHV